MNWLRKNALLIGILLLALLLRAVLVPYGLPLLLHEDEPIYLRRALLFGYGDFDPGYFKKPSFFLYFYFIFYYAYYLLGGFASWLQFENAFWRDPTTLTLIGRCVTLVFSTLSVWLLYRLGKRGFSRAVGVFAALMLALDYTHVKNTPFVISDIPALFFVLLTAWFSLSLYEKGRMKDYLLSGAGVALAMSFKYNAFAVFLPLAAHFLRELPGRKSGSDYLSAVFHKKLCAALACAGGLFLILSPFTLLNFPKFLEDVDLERRHMLLRNIHQTSRAPEFMVGFDNIFFQILPKALGWPLYLAGLGGLIHILRGFRKPELGAKGWVLLAFPLGFLMVVSQFRLINAKYLLPIIPFWFLMASVFLKSGVGKLLPRFHPGIGPKAKAFATALVLLLLGLPLFNDTLRHVFVYSQPDTRTLALAHLRQSTKPGEQVLVEPHTVPLDHRQHKGRAVLGERLANDSGFRLLREETVNRFPVQSTAPRYVILNLKPMKDERGRPKMKYAQTYYDYLSSHYRVAGVFSPKRLKDSEKSLVESVSSFTRYTDVYQALKARQGGPERPGPLLLLLQKRDSAERSGK